MGNGGSEGTGRRLFLVDVYPLVIVGGVGKHIDLALGHGGPVADRHILTDTGFDLFKRLELLFHVAGYPCICLCSRATSSHRPAVN